VDSTAASEWFVLAAGTDVKLKKKKKKSCM
jgi:hypothetical protein